MEQKQVCPCCKATFVKRNSLLQHIKRKHNLQRERIARCTRICPLCKHKSTKKQLLNHFNDVHNVKLEIEYLTFLEFTDFEKWMKQKQKETNAQFLLYKSYMTGSKPGKVIKYFECSRTGTYQPRSKGRSKTKTLGTKKINGFCPAEIICTKTAKDWRVKFVATHVGHTNEVCYLRLTKSERNSIATKIASGVPFVDVLQQIQSSLINSEGLERLHLLTMLDLHNIQRDYKLNSNTVRHSADEHNVDAWVREMKQTDNNFIITYKPQGTVLEDFPQLKEDDFMLGIMNGAQSELIQQFGSNCICIDGTRGTNTYGFSLTTLLVVDNLRCGIPCAFFISSKNDQSALESFLYSIRERVGKLSPKVFMSDLADYFFNAWVAVMGTPEHRQFSTWHVDRAWKSNLEKISDKQKQVEVYHRLCTLLEEEDKVAFHTLRQNVEEKLLGDPDTAAFGKYFVDIFLEKHVECWALCYRPLPTLANENIHKTLASIYLNGKNAKRLDTCIYALLRLVAVQVLDRLIVLNKGKITSKLKDLNRRHDMIEDCETVEDGDGWLVKSSKGRKRYHVYRASQECQCQQLCPRCKACVHLYTCSCPDSSVRRNMCKHVHAVCTFQNGSGDRPFAENTEGRDEMETDREDTDLNGRKRPIDTSEELLNLKQDYIQMFTSMVDSMSSDEMPLAEKTIRSFKIQLEVIRETGITLPKTSDASTLQSQRIVNVLSTKQQKQTVRLATPSKSEDETVTLESPGDGSQMVITVDGFLNVVHR